MLMKTKVLEITSKMNDLLEASKISMEKRTISSEQVYKNIIQLNTDLERLVTLIKREPTEI